MLETFLEQAGFRSLGNLDGTSTSSNLWTITLVCFTYGWSTTVGWFRFRSFCDIYSMSAQQEVVHHFFKRSELDFVKHFPRHSFQWSFFSKQFLANNFLLGTFYVKVSFTCICLVSGVIWEQQACFGFSQLPKKTTGWFLPYGHMIILVGLWGLSPWSG